MNIANIRRTDFHNRIFVSPMCQYSRPHDGMAYGTSWDVHSWFRRSAISSHSQGTKIAHAGRKASAVAPWLHFGTMVTVENWPENVWALSAVPYNESFPKPKELTK
ncbi:hypothetical protein M0805_003249 [Coniferiporia weirii]|nr:hypothetical protein M0805_003249 [Coniferiporia weirii]